MTMKRIVGATRKGKRAEGVRHFEFVQFRDNCSKSAELEDAAGVLAGLANQVRVS